MKISESNIELNVVRHAMRTGWLTYKFTSVANAHVPDRIFIRDGVTLFIEFKATGKKARPAQIVRIREMQKYGALVFVVDDIGEGKEILDAN